MPNDHSTFATQSRAAAFSKLKKLMHKEPAVRSLIAENEKLVAENTALREEVAAYKASSDIRGDNGASLKARIAELEAKLNQPVIVKDEAGNDIEVKLGDVAEAEEAPEAPATAPGPAAPAKKPGAKK